MKKILFLLAFLPALAHAQQKGTPVKKATSKSAAKKPVSKAEPAKGPSFVITGKIAGLPNGPVKILSATSERKVFASDSSRNGNFTLRGTVTEPGLYFLSMGKEQERYLFLENKPIRITGSKSDIKNLVIEGAQSHTDFVDFNNIFSPIVVQLNSIAMGLQREGDPMRRELMMKSYDSVVGALRQTSSEFITARPSSYVSPFLLWQIHQIVPDVFWIETEYKKMDTLVAGSEYGRMLAEYIDYAKVGAVGTDALEFVQNDTAGNPVALSSFRGKYVLVDFWASWCRPCRIENPNVVKAFNKFKDKNFTILGVSLDQQKAPWTKAIQDDGLIWSHVSDLQFWNNAAAQLYRIQSIPGNLLIDPSGKIIAKNLHGEGLEKKLCEVLGCQ